MTYNRDSSKYKKDYTLFTPIIDGADYVHAMANNIQGIDYLMEKTKPSIRICELPEDIKDAGRSGYIQCLICNGKSGTLRIITHTYKCKYKVTEEIGPFIYGNPLRGIGKIDAERSVGILQREYGNIEPIKDLPLVYNENDRLNIMKIAPLFRSTLNKVILPCFISQN